MSRLSIFPSMMATSALACLMAADGAAAAPAPAAEATLKRGMRMSWFAGPTDHLEVGLEYAKTKDAAKSMRPLGQLVGVIWSVEEREFKNTTPDGDTEIVKNLVAVGDFEAVKYSDGEVATTPSFTLPKYYLEAARAALEKNADRGTGLEFAIEIVLTPTGKQVPTAYEVRNLIPREVDSPINRLKAKVQATGRLRLPPPVGVPLLDSPEEIEGQFQVVDTAADEDDQSTDETKTNDQAGAEPAGKARGRAK